MSKSEKILDLYTTIISEQELSLKEIKNITGPVSKRTIERYIAEINRYLKKVSPDNKLYKFTRDEEKNKYVLTPGMTSAIQKKTALAVMKILLGTRIFSTKNLYEIIEEFTSNLDLTTQKIIQDTIAIEYKNYKPVSSIIKNDTLLDLLWDINEAITFEKNIEIEYSNTKNESKKHIIKPLYIMFSEYYFYLKGLKEDGRVLTFRIDRIKSFNETKIKIKGNVLPNNNLWRYKDFKYYMYDGQYTTITFEYIGIEEHITDRFPDAIIYKNKEQEDNPPHTNKYIVTINVIGEGIILWLLSQGPRVKVLSPPSIVKRMKEDTQRMRDLYI